MADSGQGELTPQRVRALQRALSAGSEELFQLLLSPDPQLLATLLRNPAIGEEHFLALLKRRDLPEELVQTIYQRHAGRLSHQLLRALVRNPMTPGAILRNLLPHLRLFELVDLCYLPGTSPDQKVAAERSIIQRLPTTPLGSKMTLARRGTACVVAELLKEGNPQLVEICLNNSRLSEAAVFQFINGPQATAATLSMVARNGRWKNRPNLQLALLKNRHTPTVWFTLWLPKLPIRTVNQLLANRRLGPAQRKALQDELARRRLRR